MSSATTRKRPEQIEREMRQTRSAMIAKVAALEKQMLGTMRTATDTVRTVREAIGSAPRTIRTTVRDGVAAVKESVGSFSVADCIRTFPIAALGTTVAGGFLAGYLSDGRRGKAVPQEFTAFTPTEAPELPPERRGLLGELLAHMGDEARLLANRAIATAAAALQRSIETQLPQVIDAAVSHATARTNGQYETSSRVWHEGCTVEVASRR